MNAVPDHATKADPAPDAPPPPLLYVQNISISFGGLKAVQDFSCAVPERGLHGLIGPNGAGKTTVFNLLTGVYCPEEGFVTVDGKRIDGLKPHQIAQAGVSRTFQNIRLFGELCVLDNVRIGCQARHPHGILSTILRSGSYVATERAIVARARRLLDLFGLAGKEYVQAKHLPYGDQRRLEIARALATGPKVLLLDEPAAGMNPQEKQELMQLIRFIRDQFGIGILLIEHDMKLVMNICERITVLDHGETIAVGTAAQVQANPEVIEAYLVEPGGDGARNDK